MGKIYLEKKVSFWQFVSYCLEIASVFFCLLFQNQNGNISISACEADLEDADMLLQEYTGNAIFSSDQIDEV